MLSPFLVSPMKIHYTLTLILLPNLPTPASWPASDSAVGISPKWSGTQGDWNQVGNRIGVTDRQALSGEAVAAAAKSLPQGSDYIHNQEETIFSWQVTHLSSSLNLTQI